jgi:hypothetical protein
MADDAQCVALTEWLLREAAHRQRYAREDPAALLQDVLARARGPQAQLQAWWRQHTGDPAGATVAFPPCLPAALAAPRRGTGRAAVGAHLRAQLVTTASGDTCLHLEAVGAQWADALVLLSWQPHEASALQQGLVLLSPPAPSGPCAGAMTLGRLTEEADVVILEQPLDRALLPALAVPLVVASIDRALDRRGWRTWYARYGATLPPALRQAIAAALEAP